MDIELMDPPSLGGLAQAEREVAPQADPVKQASEPLSIVDVATKKYMEEKAAILRQQQALLDSLQERSRPSGADMLLSMGRGFLAPTRSGSFGESLGNVGNQVSQYRENQQKNAGDLAKMRLEMNMQQLGMTKEDIGLAKSKQLTNTLQKSFLGGSGSSVPGVSNSILSGLDDQTKTLLAAQASVDPEGVMKTLVSMGVERSKVPDAIKTLEYYLSQVPEGMRERLRQFAARNSVVDPKATAAIIENVTKEIQAGRMTQEQGQKYLDENLPPSFNAPVSPVAQPAPVSPVVQSNVEAPRGMFAGKPEDIFKSIMSIPDAQTRSEALQAYAGQIKSERQATQTPVAQSSAVNSPGGFRAPSAEQMSQPSPLQRAEVKTAGLKAEAEQQVKDVTDFRKSLNENYRNSRERESDANTLIALTQKSPNIFGYFNKPTVANAVTALVQGGATIFGLGVRVPELKSALLKAGATQEEINTLQNADFISIRQQLSLASQMKGAVSNFEREIVGKAVASTEDSPNVIRWKSNITKARAAADREIYDLYQNNPNMPENKFMSLPSYKEIQDRLDARLRSNNKAYGF